MDSAIEVTEQAVERDFYRYFELACIRPVLVRCDKEDDVILLPAEEYERLRQSDALATGSTGGLT